MELFKKTYDGESIVDLFRDVSEAVSEPFNPKLHSIPKDEFGFQQGEFIVTITWNPPT